MEWYTDTTQAKGRNAIQFQKRLSVRESQVLYGREAQCEDALVQIRWPHGLRCPRCEVASHGLVYGRRIRRYQCRQCGHQTPVTARTIMEATKLPQTIWFVAFYLIGQAKTSISSLQLSQQLGVAHNTAWMPHRKILLALSERYHRYVLHGKVQMEYACFSGYRPGGKAGRGSDNKVAFVAAISLNAAVHPIHSKLFQVTGFTSELLSDWARPHLSSSFSVLSDGLACFRSVLAARYGHTVMVTAGCHPNDLPHSFDGSTSCLAT